MLPNPLIPQRADPWILRHSDGQYYFTASVPEYDRIELRRSPTIAGLATAPTKVIWHKHASGPMSWHIWAPEIHFIDGKWYIYFAAGEKDAIWNIRMWALRNDSIDAMTGEWIECGQIHPAWDSFSLDATTFTHRGRRYMAWAQADPKFDTGTCVFIDEMRDPLTLTGKQIPLTRPTYPWERIGHNVNEGPAFLFRHGRIYCTFSCAATDHNYCMGLVWADENANLLDPTSWTKLSQPVFQTCEANSQFGPGHNSFTIAEDDKTDLLVYHARNYRGVHPDPLNDPNRHARVQEFTWKDKLPVFGVPRKDTQ